MELRGLLKGVLKAPAPPCLDFELERSWTSRAIRIAMISMMGFTAFLMLKSKLYPDKRHVAVGTRSWSSPEGEVCPICLEPPRGGVRAGCGHRLCASCLKLYVETRLQPLQGKRNRPPPCPVCRAPIVSVTLTYDQINLSSPDLGSDTVDPETAKWLRRYNTSRGHIGAGKSNFFVDNAMIIVKVLLASIIVGIIARFKCLSEYGLAAYSSVFVTTFGMILMVCLWLKCQEQAAMEDDD